MVRGVPVDWSNTVAASLDEAEREVVMPGTTASSATSSPSASTAVPPRSTAPRVVARIAAHTDRQARCASSQSSSLTLSTRPSGVGPMVRAPRHERRLRARRASGATTSASGLKVALCPSWEALAHVEPLEEVGVGDDPRRLIGGRELEEVRSRLVMVRSTPGMSPCSVARVASAMASMSASVTVRPVSVVDVGRVRPVAHGVLPIRVRGGTPRKMPPLACDRLGGRLVLGARRAAVALGVRRHVPLGVGLVVGDDLDLGLVDGRVALVVEAKPTRPAPPAPRRSAPTRRRRARRA
jgi:hypothetical protein